MHPSPTKLLREYVRAEMSRLGVGVRSFEERLGLKKWALHGFLDPEREQVPNLDRAADLCERLGLELTISKKDEGVSPPRTGSLNGGANPPPGFAEPPETFRLDAAPGIWRRPARPLPDRPFVLEVPDIFREELEAAFALVDPTVPVELGALVCARDAEGRVAFGRYLGLGTRPGWIRLRLHGGAAIDERARAATPHLDPVTWRGTTPPRDRLAMTPGQKARLLADARRHLRYVEELLEEDDR